MTAIESRLYSLAEIVQEQPAWQFNVPIYQRLYVWGDDQVQTLLSDLLNAFERKAPLFFLGGTLLVEQERTAQVQRLDLIDGQQRLTTLWLLCCAWGGALAPFVVMPGTPATAAPVPRLGFAIRPSVDRWLQALALALAPQTVREAADAAGTPDMPGTERMGHALQTMRALAAERAGSVDWQALTRFVFEDVRFVVTRVPPKTDLNKLFEVINNRGVQLQHHEILKARMLHVLGDADRSAYAVLWDACADMDNYVERSLSAVSGLPAYQVCEMLHLRDALTDAPAVVRLLQSRPARPGAGGARTLAQILDTQPAVGDTSSVPGEDGSDSTPSTRVRSIIGFALLLQHALRIWRCEQGLPDLPRLLDRELLALFGQHFEDAETEPDREAAARVRSFLHLLWRLRVLFDAHVIKWVDQGQDKVHLISATSVGASNGHRYLNRSADSDVHRGMAMLQSMLYHSQEITTHYWLTPWLMHLHRHEAEGAEAHFRYLQHLDNHLLGTACSETLAVRTRSFMEQPWQMRKPAHAQLLEATNNMWPAHYWFYKLEFVLWFQEFRPGPLWNHFRLTSKNSVEHVSPQKPSEHELSPVSKDMLDQFGNLALLSRHTNSQYSNRTFRQKRQKFLDENTSRLESLKLALIYESQLWDDDAVKAHQAQMIACLDSYVRACDAQMGMDRS